MPKHQNIKAAELHEAAAKSHHAAAELHGKKDDKAGLDHCARHAVSLKRRIRRPPTPASKAQRLTQSNNYIWPGRRIVPAKFSCEHAMLFPHHPQCEYPRSISN